MFFSWYWDPPEIAILPKKFETINTNKMHDCTHAHMQLQSFAELHSSRTHQRAHTRPRMHFARAHTHSRHTDAITHTNNSNTHATTHTYKHVHVRTTARKTHANKPIQNARLHSRTHRHTHTRSCSHLELVYTSQPRFE